MRLVRNTTLALATALACNLGSAYAASGETVRESRGSEAASTPPQSFVRTTRMIGREIVDESGRALGEVEEYVVDGDGRAFAVIAMGGFLGLAQTEVLVPHTAIRLSPHTPGLLVFTGDPADLEQASRFRADRDALRATARERRLMLEVREETQDVKKAERALDDARAQLDEEREELLAAQRARERSQ